MNIKAITLGVVITLTAATAVLALNNRIATIQDETQICILTTSETGQGINICSGTIGK